MEQNEGLIAKALEGANNSASDYHGDPHGGHHGDNHTRGAGMSATFEARHGSDSSTDSPTNTQEGELAQGKQREFKFHAYLQHGLGKRTRWI